MGKGKKSNDDILGALVLMVIAFVVGLVAFLLCFCPTSRKVRIGLTWFWAISLALTSGLCLAFVTFAAVDRENLREQDIKFTQYRGFFNDEIKAKTNKSTNFFYFRGKMPDISYTNKTQTKYNLVGKYGGVLRGQSRQYYVFHLLKGTRIRQYYRISRCCNDIEFFIVKGKSNYNSWKGKKYNYQRKDAAEFHKTLYYNTWQRELINEFDVPINDTADYYFIYAAFGLTVNIQTLILEIDRTTYNTENYVHRCLASTNCTYPLIGDLNQIALVISSKNTTDNMSNKTRQVDIPLIASSRESTRERLQTSHKMRLQISVTSRTWTYVVIFGVLPFFLACVVSLVIWKFCKDCSSIFSKNDSTETEDTATSSPDVVPPVSSIEPQHNQAFAPPAYPGGASESNFQSNYNVQYGGFLELNKVPDAAPPPSYEEAVRS